MEDRRRKFEKTLLIEMIALALTIILCCVGIVVVAKIAGDKIEITNKK